MNRRKLLGAIGIGAAALGIRKREARAFGYGPALLCDTIGPGDSTHHWTVPFGAAMEAFSVTVASGALVPAGASVTVWVSLNGGAHYDAVINAGERAARKSIGYVVADSDDIIRCNVTFSGMAAVPINIALSLG